MDVEKLRTASDQILEIADMWEKASPEKKAELAGEFQAILKARAELVIAEADNILSNPVEADAQVLNPATTPEAQPPGAKK